MYKEVQIVNTTRNLYRKYIRLPQLDAFIYAILDALTDAYAFFARFAFPANYIRRWKLNMLWGLYEKETFKLFEKIIKPGMIIVDVGAHIGYFTRLFSRRAGHKGMVYAFEPDPENFSLLKKNMRHRKNIKLFPLAISDTKEVMTFYQSEKTGCNSLIPDPSSRTKGEISVPSITLDEILLGTEKISRIDIIKMDIEGGEMLALKGMHRVLSSNPHVALILEFNPECLNKAQVKPEDFLIFIHNAGFKIFAIQQKSLVEIKQNMFLEYKKLLTQSDFVNLYCIKPTAPWYE